MRHRAEAVEYRIEQHVAKLEARLKALRGVGFGTTNWHHGVELSTNAISRCSTTTPP